MIDQWKTRLYFLDASGRNSKSFCYKFSSNQCPEEKEITLATENSVIVATLLPGDRTAHAAFKLRFNLTSNDEPVGNISNIPSSLIFSWNILWSYETKLQCPMKNLQKLFTESIRIWVISVVWWEVRQKYFQGISDKLCQWFPVRQRQMNWKQVGNLYFFMEIYQRVKAFYKYEGIFAWGSSVGTICPIYFASWRRKARYQTEICTLVFSVESVFTYLRASQTRKLTTSRPYYYRSPRVVGCLCLLEYIDQKYSL